MIKEHKDMRCAAKSSRKSFIMRTIVPCLVISFVVCLVFSADVSGILKDSINYIVHRNDDNEGPVWTYSCKDKCIRTEMSKNGTSKGTTLETCNMLCGDLPLWPKPTSTRLLLRNVSTFTKNRVFIKLNTPNAIKSDLKELSGIFMENLPSTDEYWTDDEDDVSFNIHINVSTDENVLRISTDESYQLLVTGLGNIVVVDISADTYFGARHALETLSQLIWLDSDNKKLNIIHNVEINDEPTFAHRGLMVDTARNYFYVEQLKKVLDGMAATKLNVFHLHLTDATSFPIVLPRYKNFAKYGAYSPDMVYTAEDIKDLVEYARIRGIRVILEIDAPSHLTPTLNEVVNDLVICGDTPFNGHLNPYNNETLHVLENIYRDLLDLGTDKEMFHIGGDEVNLTCWERNTVNQENEHLVDKGLAQKLINKISLSTQWAQFTNQMFDKVVSANKQTIPQHMVMWSSDLTDSYISTLKYKENIVVQYWYGSIYPILQNGNKVILSTVGHWYLDCGYGSWKPNRDIGVCDPYTTWHTFYKYRPWVESFSNYREQVLGGEACLWSEMVEVDSLETRIWPRAAALAERLWSDPNTFDRHDVYPRLDIHRERLRRRGIRSEAIWPRWCSQNPGKC